MVGALAEFEREMISGRNTGAQMARLYNVSEATNSRIVARFRHHSS